MNDSNLELRNVTPDFPNLILPNGRPVTSIEVDVDSLQREEKYQFGGWDDLIRTITAQWVQQNMYAGQGTIWQWGSASVNFGQRSYSMFYVVLGMPKAFRQYLKTEIRVLGKHVRPHSDELIPRLEDGWGAMCYVEEKKVWESLDPTLWQEIHVGVSMNIFSVLSQGKSRLHEPSISAMLGYLLSPHGDHGLGDTFLRSFLLIINHSTNKSNNLGGILERKFINANVELEVQYVHEGKRNDIDIKISFYDSTSKEIHQVIIENKIKVGAANPKQLSDYYNAVRMNEDFILEKPDLTMVFLTPKSLNKALALEYANLQKIISNKHQCIWLYWLANNDQESVLGLIKEILKQELVSEINPINEYMRHTLKAFVRHVSFITSINTERSKMRRGEDIGIIVEEVEIQTSDGVRHRVVRRDSTQIQVFNLETDEKEVARHIMADYIDENGLDIQHARLNTRAIGKLLLDYLRAVKTPISK